METVCKHKEGVVESIVRDSLKLSDGVEIAQRSVISKLGDSYVERSDIIDILDRSGVYHQEHFSSGEINDKGRDYLKTVSELAGSGGYSAGRFDLLSELPTKMIMNRLRVSDVYEMRRADNVA
ncbi:MAG: hypothetical protein KJ592_00655 [Nanoarchaeota archaeon]|nr:hypothetical protein [Nanoarchaeota archaeon]